MKVPSLEHAVLNEYEISRNLNEMGGDGDNKVQVN